MTGEPRGFAYVEFIEPESVTKAIQELNNVEVLGKLLYCMAMEKKKKKVGTVGLNCYIHTV